MRRCAPHSSTMGARNDDKRGDDDVEHAEIGPRLY